MRIVGNREPSPCKRNGRLDDVPLGGRLQILHNHVSCLLDGQNRLTHVCRQRLGAEKSIHACHVLAHFVPSRRTRLVQLVLVIIVVERLRV